MNIRNRVVKMEMMSPKDITFNEKNWRKHPAGQSKALQGILEEIGIAGAMLAYYSERNGGKLTLVDGHLRKELAPGEQWPILITDLNDSEADLLLASYDPISGMATADKEKLDAILRDVHTDNAAVQDMLSKMAEKNGIFSDFKDNAEVFIPEKFVIQIECQDERQQTDLLNRFIDEGLQCRALQS